MTAERTVNVRQVVRDIQWRNENTIIYVTHSGMLNQIDTRIQKIVSYNIYLPYCLSFINKLQNIS